MILMRFFVNCEHFLDGPLCKYKNHPCVDKTERKSVSANIILNPSSIFSAS